jgi:endonuclease G
MSHIFYCSILLVLTFFTLSGNAEYKSAFGQVEPKQSNIRRLDYEGFTIWLDCSKRSAVKFMYNAQRDTGNHKRYSRFFIDPNVPSECQQYSGKTYGQGYDRGHLVPANHLDFSKSAIKASNTMTNITPQSAKMNRGAWLMTEEITECYRDIDELLIIGGVLWSKQNKSGSQFINSHGIKTPSAFWKVIIRGVGSNLRTIAWIIPNAKTAKRKILDQYIVSILEIERLTGQKIPVPEYEKENKPDNSWLLPRGCNKG